MLAIIKLLIIQRNFQFWIRNFVQIFIFIKFFIFIKEFYKKKKKISFLE